MNDKNGFASFAAIAPSVHGAFTATRFHEPARRGRVHVQPLRSLDGAYAFLLFASALSIVSLGTYGALLFTLTTLGFIALRPAALMQGLRNGWPLLIFPAFALLSTVWSEMPSTTLKHGMEFFLTIVAALLLSSSTNPRSTFFGIFIAFAAFAIVSVAVGTSVEVGDSGKLALSGLDESKNQEADAVAAGFLVTSLWFWISWRTRNVAQCALAVGAGLVQAYATVAARSWGAAAGLVVALAVFATLILLCGAGRNVRAAVLGIGATAVLTVATMALTMTGEVLGLLAVLFGKDVTLTGRTYLWERAHDLVLEQPVVGRGFEAFWQRGNLDAEGIWRFAHIDSRMGFNFHNTAYDVLVALGWVGLLLFGLTLLAGFSWLAVRYVRKPTLLTSFWLALGVYLIIRMPIETIGIYEFYFSTVMLFAIFASAVDRPSAAPAGFRFSPDARRLAA